MCKRAIILNLVKKTALFTIIFLFFLTCSSATKQIYAIDPVGFVSDIFANTINVKTEKIQPDIKPDSLLKAKTEKIQPDIPKFPTKKTEKLLPKIEIMNSIRDKVVMHPEKIGDSIAEAFIGFPEGAKYLTGFDIIEKKYNIDDKGKTPWDINFVSIGYASNEDGISGKGPAKVPLYGKTPFIKDPITDLGNITGDYLNDVAPIHKVMPAISGNGGEILDDVNSYLDDTIDLFDKSSKTTPEKELDRAEFYFAD